MPLLKLKEKADQPRRVLIAAAAAIVALIVFVFGAARESSAASPACAKGPRVLTGAKAYLVDAGGDAGLIGCVKGSARSVRVSTGSWTRPALSGTYAAVQVTDDYKCSTTELTVVNLRTGSARFYPAGTFRGGYVDASGCAPYGRDTTDIALRSDGAIAFITEDGEVARSTPQPGNRLVTLDRGPNVLRDSLRLTSSGLTWVSDGQRRTARLPAHGRRTASRRTAARA